jgi:hypothetical protein
MAGFLLLRPWRVGRIAGLALGAVLAGGSVLGADTSSVSVAVVSESTQRADAALKLERPVSVDFKERRLREVLTSIGAEAGVQIHACWTAGRDAGLDAEQLVSLAAERTPALHVLERVLEVAGEQNTWQIGAAGTVEVGPKSRLNRLRRTEVFDVSDLLLVVPDYTDAPSIDLQQAIQAGSRGGGSVIHEASDSRPRVLTKTQRLDDLIAIVTETVEPDQWVIRGGDGATIRGSGGQIIVTAPGYVLRQIGSGR